MVAGDRRLNDHGPLTIDHRPLCVPPYEEYLCVPMEPASSFPDIRSQLSHNNLFTAFKLQLTKEFAQSNWPSDFVDALTADYEMILSTIAAVLRRHESKDLMPLLYRVDISESQLRRYLDANPDTDRFSVIAELIIKRVLQKVVVRSLYKN